MMKHNPSPPLRRGGQDTRWVSVGASPSTTDDFEVTAPVTPRRGNQRAQGRTAKKYPAALKAEIQKLVGQSV
jgi:hypothetical protein